MDDDWDKILLHKDSNENSGVKNIRIPNDITRDDIPAATETVPEKITAEAPKEVPKEPPKEILKTSVPKAADILSFLPKIDKPGKKKIFTAIASPQKTVSPYISPSPYGPRAPAVWSAEWANKFATLAVAMVISFGIYTYAGYVANFGLKPVALAIMDSVGIKGEKLRDTLALIAGQKDNFNKSQVAAPASAILKF